MADATRIIKPREYAALKNIVGCMHLVTRLRNRGGQDANIGVMHGFPGVGKSWASIYTQNKTGAIRVLAWDKITRKTLVEKILGELGVAKPKGSLDRLKEEAIMLLSDQPDRPLIIDEADRLMYAGMIETVRDLADNAQVPVLLIGEEGFPQKLQQYERLHSRVLDWFPAQLCDAEDARKLANLFCPDVRLSDDLVEKTRIASDGRARRIVISLNHIREFAKKIGAKELDAAAYKGEFASKTPIVRNPRAELVGRAM